MNYLKNLDLKKYLIFLVPVLLVYFFVSHGFQKFVQPGIINPDIQDAYPNLPHLPEPYEVPIYLASFVVVPALALLFYYLWKFRVVRMVTVTGLISAGLTAGYTVAGTVFAHHIFSLSFITGYLSRQSLPHLVWLLATKRLYILRMAFGAGLVVLILNLIQPWPVSWLADWARSDKFKRFTPYLLIGLAVLLFHPNFPSQDGFTNFMLSPASEILHGKGLLYDSMTQYGLLPVYLLALLMKFILPLSFKSLALVMMIFYLIFYFLLYKLLKIWTNSRLFALFGTWLAVIAGFFLLTDPYITAYTYPGQSAFRQGFWIFTAALLTRLSQQPKRFKKDAIMAMVAISLFWNFDTGVYTTVAAFAALAIYDLNFERNLSDNFKRIMFTGFRQLAYIALSFGIISLTNFLIFSPFLRICPAKP